MSVEINVKICEDGSLLILARLAADNGSGSATGNDGEGHFLQQVDFASITRDVFDTDSTTPGTATENDTLVISTVILNTPLDTSTNILWTADDYGYNFKDKIPPNYFPTGNRRYRIEYFVVLAGGEQFSFAAEGMAGPRRAG